ncbi:MAG TPA: hypothetical protein VFU22_09575 [Roseiflexaceae bacterium]|nr:hypothetical protein [Roseiflexaceae bacterium]
MRIQTYAVWVHQPMPSQDGELASFIDGLIAQVAYYPSFVTQIMRDAQGQLLAGKQRVVETAEQGDGMVALRTEARAVWVTRADYQRLLSI